MNVKEFIKEYARANQIKNIDDWYITFSLWDKIHGQYFYKGRIDKKQSNYAVLTYDIPSTKNEEYLHIYLDQ